MRRTTLLILCSLSFIGCASTSRPSSAAASSSPVEFALKDAHGDDVSFAEFRGKPAIIDFWASWCEPCKTAMPFFDELHGKYGDRLVVIGVSVDDDPAKMRAALEQRPVRFLILNDPKGELAARMNVETMPSTFVVDQKGVVRNVHRGFVASDRTGIEAEVAALLSEPAASTK